jgi:hypothetical protein
MRPMQSWKWVVWALVALAFSGLMAANILRDEPSKFSETEYVTN